MSTAPPTTTLAPAPAADPPRRGRHARRESPDVALLLTVALVLLGVAVRVRQWAHGRSLWLDEALLAPSLLRDLPTLLTEPLLSNQSAPTLWLAAARGAVVAFGDGERALRLVPLLGGCAAVVLTALLARGLTAASGLGRWVPPLAVALVALHPELVYYSVELKPYSVDVAVTLALLLVALRGRPLALGLWGAVAVWASFPAVFVLAGCSVLLALRPPTWAARVRAALQLLPWVLSFGAAYLLVLRALGEREVLSVFWAYAYPDAHPGGDLVAWLLGRGRDLALTPLALVPDGPLRAPASVLLGLALLLGAARLLRRAPLATGLVLSGVPFAVLAGALAAYPLADRLALWLVPLALLLLAALVSGRTAWLGLLVVALLAGPGAVRTAPQLVRPEPLQELRPVLTEVAGRLQPGDQVLVDIAAKAAFDWYGPRLGVPRDGVVLFQDDDDGCEEDFVALRTGRFGSQRTWLVFSHDLTEASALGSRDDLLSRIGTVTRLVDTVEAPGAQALLLDPSGEDLPRAPETPGRCLVVNRSAT